MCGMRREGHVGLTLALVGSALYALNLVSSTYLLMLVASAALSALPDIDLRLEIPHRKYTHNVFVASALSLGVGVVAWHLGFDFWMSFLPCFLGFTCHIAGDLMTYMKFPPLWPVVKREVSLGLFRSDSSLANGAFFASGLLVLVAYTLKMAYAA